MKKQALLYLMLLLVVGLAASVFAVNPQFSTTNPGSVAVEVGKELNISINATEPDNGSNVFSISGQPSFVNLIQVNNTTAIVQILPTLSSQVGSHAFSVTVEDGNSSADAPQTILLTVNPESSGTDPLTVNNVVLGNDDQKRNQTITGTITITNNGNEAVSGLSAAFVGGDSVATDSEHLFNVRFDTAQTLASINKDEFTTIRVTAFLPIDFDAVDRSTGIEQAFIIGNIRISGTTTSGAVEKSITLSMQAENNLRIEDVEVCVEDDCKEVSDGDDVKDIKPRDSLRVTATVENKFSDSSSDRNDPTKDIDIEDVVLIFRTDDDEDINFDDEEDLDTLNADDQDSESVTEDVEDDAADGSTKLTITTIGIDENGASHGDVADIDLDVEREDHEIEIRAASFNPTSVSCARPTTTFTMNVNNIGKSNERRAAVGLSNTEFNVEERREFELDEDESKNERFTITIPVDAQPGPYVFLAETFYDTSSPSNSAPVTLNVKECPTGTPGTNSNSGSQTGTSSSTTTPTTPAAVVPPVTTTPTVPPVVAQPPVRVPAGDDEEGGSNVLYIILIVAGIVVVLGLILLLLLGVLLKR